MKQCVSLALAVLCSTSTVPANDIGYIEKFALADDREKALKELIPGTRDYYFYHALHYQHTGQYDKVRDTLKQWIKRYGYTGRVEQIRNRQALLEYNTNSETTLKHLRDRLGLRFNHQKIELEKKVTLPTTLDQNLISFDRLAKIAFSHRKNTSNFEESAFDYLVRTPLNSDQRRHLLSRLKRPDYPGVVKLIVDDLNTKHSGGFGSHRVHRELLVEQLEECLKLKPELIKNTNFINTYLVKLKPSEDTDWKRDPREQDAYLARLEAFVRRLPPVQNSLKAHVLYKRLLVDQKRGVFNKERFDEYIRLPRNVHYVNRDYLKKRQFYGRTVNMKSDFRAYTELPPIGTDEKLVRYYLMHYLKDAADFKAYEDYVEHNYLKKLFAETKMVNGIGDMEEWYSQLKPSEVRSLKERIDLELLPTNPEFVDADDPVMLSLAIKNVEKLIVRTFEVNTYNYYREKKSEISTAIDLDGLVANIEYTHEYKHIPLRRHVETFKFPHIKKPGVYVVEFIGNGISSRALIRKGRLLYTQRLGSAGHVFNVFDGIGQRLKDTTIWLSGHEYTADDDGEIAVPFTACPGLQDIVITHDGFSALGRFRHESENYALNASFYAERETLLDRETCRVVMRPELTVNGIHVDVGLLEKPVLTITTTDIEGISTSKEVKDLKFDDRKELVYEFKVPKNLVALNFGLRGKVRNISQNKKVDLADSRSLSVNLVDRTDKTEDLHLRHSAKGYTLELLGKTGEAKPGRAVHFTFKHKDFTRREHVSLKTDELGRIHLGALKDIVYVTARGPENTSHTWTLPANACAHRPVVHALVGETIRIPFMRETPEDLACAVSLLEKRGNTFVRDFRKQASIQDGFLVIEDLPAGDFSCFIKSSNRYLTIRVTNGKKVGDQLLSKHRVLGQGNMTPLQIKSVVEKDDDILITLGHATRSTRVHVIATRFVDAYTPFSLIGSPTILSPVATRFLMPRSLYVSGRNIGDEYRYVLERKYAKRFPGNMLKRPSLLLNPWSIRKTDTGHQFAEPPVIMKGIYGSRSPGSRGAAHGRYGGSAATGAGFSNLDFLPSVSMVLENLVPNRKGQIEIPKEALGNGQQVHVVALNVDNAVYREIALARKKEDHRDRRHARVLKPDAHFSEQKNISIAKAGNAFAVEDLRTSKVEVYDSLPKVFKLYSTLSGNATLAEFGFVLNWPEMEPEEQKELYTKYACHELNFFLYNKDPEFFKSVILPYLANKKDKTFLDHWLLGETLDRFLQPWEYGRLNIVERALLAQRIRGEAAHGARHVKDLYDLIPPDIEQYNYFFKTALKSGALESQGLAVALGEAEELAFEVPVDGAKLAGGGFGGGYLKAGAARPVARGLAADAPKASSAPETAPARKLLERRQSVAKDELKELDMRAADEHVVADAEYFDFKEKDRERRESARRFYQKLDKTEEWVENNYYHLPIEQQVAGLVSVNGFWKDYAGFDGKAGFLSPNIAEASRSFTEMMMALAVTDLPFKSAEHKTDLKGARLELTPKNSAIVFHKEIKHVKSAEDAKVILVSQNFFARDDRYRHENNERFDKFVTEEFRTHRVYGCRVALTNPTSSRRKIDVLLQIPEGAMPVLNGFYTRSLHRRLDPYATQTVEFFFYFPASGKYRHYPVHVAQGETLIASAEPFVFNVKTKLTKLDTESWPYVSQHAGEGQVLAYLRDHNIDRLDLEMIAFRMRNREFFNVVIPLLHQRHVYNGTLWSYGVYHNDVSVMRQYLPHTSFAKQCGPAIESPLLTLNPIERHVYQHKEYWPLVNARVYQLGKKRRILNHQFHQQYDRAMRVLSYRPKLTDADRMSAVIYLLLQDRVTEAMKFFDAISDRKIHTDIQHDYLKAYMAFYRESPDAAKRLAKKYEEHPVKRWRHLFQDVIAQAEEIESGKAKVVDQEDRAQQQTQLADTAPNLELKVENRVATIRYKNLEACRVNFYLMDIELLFSRQPFVQAGSGQFSVIKPNKTLITKLPKGKNSLNLELPEQFRDRNIMIEIAAAGIKRMQAYYPNSLCIQMMENYGQVRVTHEQTGKPLSKIYVKVYARMHGGDVQFFKDGYTDLRGRFDYTSLNTNEIENVQKFAVLIISDKHGAVVREAEKPKM